MVAEVEVVVAIGVVGVEARVGVSQSNLTKELSSRLSPCSLTDEEVGEEPFAWEKAALSFPILMLLAGGDCGVFPLVWARFVYLGISLK